MRLASVLTALLLGSLAVWGSACVNGPVQSYIDLGSAGCAVGPYTFYNFGFSQSETGGASLPSIDSVKIDPVVDDAEVVGIPWIETGVLISGNWTAAPGQSIMYSLLFSIELTEGGYLTGSAIAGWTPDGFIGSLPGDNTWGVNYVFGFASGEISGQNLFHLSNACIICPGDGGGASFTFSPAVYDSVSNKDYDLTQLSFLNVDVTKILQAASTNSANSQDLGMFGGLGPIPADVSPEPSYLPLVGLALLIFKLHKRS